MILKNRGCIFSHVRLFYEQAVSNLGRLRSMHIPVYVAHSSFIEGLHTTKNKASGDQLIQRWKRNPPNNLWPTQYFGRHSYDPNTWSTVDWTARLFFTPCVSTKSPSAKRFSTKSRRTLIIALNAFVLLRRRRLLNCKDIFTSPEHKTFVRKTGWSCKEFLLASSTPSWCSE